MLRNCFGSNINRVCGIMKMMITEWSKPLDEDRLRLRKSLYGLNINEYKGLSKKLKGKLWSRG